MATLPALRRIVRVRLFPRGRKKPRPVIVIGPILARADAAAIKVVVCSTDFDPNALAPNEFILPGGPPWPDPVTLLVEPTAVIWDWLEDITVHDIESYDGEVPNTVMLEIFKRLKAKFRTTDPDLLPKRGDYQSPGLN